MKNDTFNETAVGVGLIVLLILLVNPFEIFMPSRVTMMLLGGVAILAFLFIVFVWKETAQDERESVHRLLAGRSAFLAGASILLLGIAFQTIQHRLDPWLVVALGTMVLTKLLTRAHSRTKH